MEFGFSAEELAFADDIRRFLRAHPPAEFSHDGMDAGYGSGAHSHAFLRALAAEGWLSMTWPRAFGGAERPLMHKLILLEELGAAGAPFGPLANCWTTADAIRRAWPAPRAAPPDRQERARARGDLHVAHHSLRLGWEEVRKRGRSPSSFLGRHD